MKARIERMKGDEGFTLIELLIVIIILGILAAIVVFAVGNTRTDAVANSCKTDAKSIQLSAEAVKTNTGLYPVQAGLLEAGGGLLKTYPTSTNYVLTYTQTGGGSGFTLTSSIANCGVPVT